MATDFGSAPQGQGGELIPAGTLAFATINIRPASIEFQKICKSGRENKANKYLDYELELTSGPYTGRKMFGMIGVSGSEQWVNMSMAAVRHILEVGRRAGAENPQGYVLGAQLPDGDERMWMELDGLQCAIKVGIEKGKDNYPDKNRVSQFLSPNASSPTVKDFLALAGGATMAAGEPATAPAKPAASAPWAPGAAGNLAAQQPRAVSESAGRPAWAGAPPVSNVSQSVAQKTDAPF